LTRVLREEVTELPPEPAELARAPPDEVPEIAVELAALADEAPEFVDPLAELAEETAEVAACVAGAAEVVTSACAVALPEADPAAPPTRLMSVQKSRNC